MNDLPGLRMGTAQARWVLLATVLGSGLAMLDATVVNVALGHIGEDLGADFTALQWTLNAYTLTLAALLLLGGSLGDRFGRRRVFVIGVVWFAAASVLCGCAPNVGTLIAARALQGVGGALLAPGSLAIISASFRGPDRAAAIGVWSGLGGIAAAAGPFLGGWLVAWTWRAVFWINLPLAAVVVVVAARHVPDSRDPDAPARVDLAGTVLAVAGLGGVSYGLTSLRDGGLAVAALFAGAACLLGFVVVERSSRAPLVPGGLFTDPQFVAANVVTLLVYAALGVVFALLVLALQVVAGFTPVAAGSALLPVTAVMLVFSARAGALAQRIGPRLPMTLGPVLAAAGVLLMTRIDAAATWLGEVAPAALLLGSGLALTVAPLTATVLAAAPDRYAGVASAVNNATARAGGLLAVAVVPVLAGIGGRDWADPTALAPGFRTGMRICAGLFAAGALLSWTSIRRTE